MSKKISRLDPVAPGPKHSDEVAARRGSANIKFDVAQMLHDTTFVEEEHLMAYAMRNPHRFITYYNDFNVVPFWDIAPSSPTTGKWQELFGWGQNMTGPKVYIALTGSSSVNSALSLEAGTVLGDMSILTPADQQGSGGTWLWRVDDNHEFIMAAAFTWSRTSDMLYRVGCAESSAEVKDLSVATTSPRFECIGVENLHFRWGVGGGVEHELDTGIIGTGKPGSIQGAEDSMHTLLVHHKDGIVRLFVDSVLTETTVAKAVGTDNEQTFVLGCGVTAGGITASLNIDYFLMAVQRSGQLVGGP